MFFKKKPNFKLLFIHHFLFSFLNLREVGGANFDFDLKRILAGGRGVTTLAPPVPGLMYIYIYTLT